MVSLETPVCDFGVPAIDFSLPGVDGQQWTLEKCRGNNGLLVMFICNHCPYVQSIRDRIVRDTSELLGLGINSVAIMSNDPADYPEDSFDNMGKVAAEFDFPFPYLLDESQQVAQSYGAVCTPDFFGYNADLELQYRGRMDESRKQAAQPNVRRDLFEAMKQVAETVKEPAINMTVNGNAIVVPESDQLAEAEHSCQRTGLVRDAFHEAAIAKKHISIVINDGVTGAVEFGRQCALRNRHADRVCDSLSQRTGGGFHARRITILGVTRGL